jgi:hypothetical protein
MGDLPLGPDRPPKTKPRHGQGSIHLRTTKRSVEGQGISQDLTYLKEKPRQGRGSIHLGAAERSRAKAKGETLKLLLRDHNEFSLSGMSPASRHRHEFRKTS